MAEAVYALCALTSLGCAALLIRSYLAGRARLLLWCSICFIGLAVNNVLLFVDLVVLPSTIDLSMIRNLSSFTALAMLIFGLVWDSR
jgi:hypothetical protein